MASNVCFRGATGRLALGHAPSPGPPAPRTPGQRALRAGPQHRSRLGGMASRQAFKPVGRGPLFPAGDSRATTGHRCCWFLGGKTRSGRCAPFQLQGPKPHTLERLFQAAGSLLARRRRALLGAWRWGHKQPSRQGGFLIPSSEKNSIFFFFC